MSHDHRTIHTSGHTVLYNHHTTSTVSYDCHTINTVQVRIIHGQVRPDTVSTSVQSSCMVIQAWSTTDNTTCYHIERNPIKFENLCSQAIKTSQFISNHTRMCDNLIPSENKIDLKPYGQLREIIAGANSGRHCK